MNTGNSIFLTVLLLVACFAALGILAYDKVISESKVQEMKAQIVSLQESLKQSDAVKEQALQKLQKLAQDLRNEHMAKEQAITDMENLQVKYTETLKVMEDERGAKEAALIENQNLKDQVSLLSNNLEKERMSKQQVQSELDQVKAELSKYQRVNKVPSLLEDGERITKEYPIMPVIMAIGLVVAGGFGLRSWKRNKLISSIRISGISKPHPRFSGSTSPISSRLAVYKPYYKD